jgi:aminoglycoside phosphotransferase (APT) family kinase protein
VRTDEAREVLDVVAEGLGRVIRSHRVISETVGGDGVVSGHELELVASDGSALKQLVYLESRPTTQHRDGVLVIRDDESGDEVAVWLYPGDPALPALSPVVHSDAAAVLLRRLGLDATELHLKVVAYRPGRRAVVRANTASATRYLKVVPPQMVAALHELYALWSAHDISVPATLGWTPDGMIAFESLPGVPSSSVLAALDDEIKAEDFISGVERLAADIALIHSTGEARHSLASRVGWYERRLAADVPALAAEVARVRRGVKAVLAEAGPFEPVTIHGDLHVGQLFVAESDPARITGVLDIDTAGFGDPADDAAALYAHLIVTALFHRARGEVAQADAAERLAERWRTRWSRQPDAGLQTRARAIAATHLLAHAVGGFAHQRELVARALVLLQA